MEEAAVRGVLYVEPNLMARCLTGMEREGQVKRIFRCLGHQGMGNLGVMGIWMVELG